jgi:hypothetical protein
MVRDGWKADGLLFAKGPPNRTSAATRRKISSTTLDKSRIVTDNSGLSGGSGREVGALRSRKIGRLGLDRFLPASVLAMGFIVACPSAAAFDMGDMCWDLTAGNPEEASGFLKVGRVVGPVPVELKTWLPSACDAPCSKMKGRTVRSGDTIAIGQSKSGFVCAHLMTDRVGNEAHGWLPEDRVEVRDPLKVSIPLDQWAGAWVAGSEAATIKLKIVGDSIHLDGHAVYPNAEAPRAEGNIDATVRPTGSVASFTDPDGCLMSMTVIGETLAVTDNGECGGTNVRFSALYRRSSN